MTETKSKNPQPYVVRASDEFVPRIIKDTDIYNIIASVYKMDLHEVNSKQSINKIFRIGRIEAIELENVIKITIHSYRPGILIGKAGRFIDLIEKAIEYTYDKQVDVVLKELRDFI